MQMTLAGSLCLNTSNTKVMHLLILKAVGCRKETEAIQNEIWKGGTNLKLMWQSQAETDLTMMLRMCMMSNLKGPLFLQEHIFQVNVVIFCHEIEPHATGSCRLSAQ